jgi:hypothetical protein
VNILFFIFFFSCLFFVGGFILFFLEGGVGVVLDFIFLGGFLGFLARSVGEGGLASG